MHKSTHTLFVLALCLGIFLSRESGHRSYKEYLKRYKAYKRMYYGQYQPGKISGWCDYSPKWTVDGINPVYDEISKNHHVLLYLLRRDCKSCFHELNGLHLLAEYYRNAVQNTEYHYQRLCGYCISRSLWSIPTSISTTTKRTTPENKMISIQLCDNTQNSSTKGEIRYLDLDFNSKRLIDLHVFKMGNKMNSTYNIDGVKNNIIFNIGYIGKVGSNLPAYTIKSVHITSTTRKKIIIHKIDGPYN